MSNKINERDSYKMILNYIYKDGSEKNKRKIPNIDMNGIYFKQIINNINFYYCDVCYLYKFLRKYKEFWNPKIQMRIFDRINRLSDRSFRKVIYDDSSSATYLFISLFDLDYQKAIFRRLWKTMGEYEGQDLRIDIKIKKDFIDSYKKFCPKNLRFEKIILDGIIGEILKFKDQETVHYKLELLQYFIGNRKINFGKKNVIEILNEMSNDFNFTYLILNPRSYNKNSESNYQLKFSFVETNIINNIGENTIIELLKKMISQDDNEKEKYNFNKNSINDINKMFILMEKLVKNSNNEKQNFDNIKSIVNEIFEKQKNTSDCYKVIVFARYFSNSLYHYLSKENQDELIKFVFTQKSFKLDYEDLTKLIVNHEIDDEQFDFIWNNLFHEKENVNYSNFLLIKNILNRFNDLDSHIMTMLTKYIEDNKQEYLEYVNFFSIKWSDFEVECMCKTENVFSIYPFLSKKDNFTKEQWCNVFVYFYNNDEFDIEKLYASQEKYRKYHTNYLEKHEPLRYIDDGDNLNQINQVFYCKKFNYSMI